MDLATAYRRWVDTRKRDPSGHEWYSLDNAATIMPATLGPRATSLFRIAAVMRDPVNVNALQRAVDVVSRRFPYFNVRLRKGFFWYYLEHVDATPRVELDPESPCMRFDPWGPLIRVRARGRKLACEFSHILTDGTGGFTWFRTLLRRYLLEIGVDPGVDPDALDTDGTPHPEECEDAYQRYFKDGRYPHPDPGRDAFHVEDEFLPPDAYRVIRGSMPLEPVRVLAKKYGASLTDFLTAVLMYAVQEAWFALPAGDRRRRRHWNAIEVPVNMRKIYPTRTMRNFSLFVIPRLDMRLGRLEFDDVVSAVFHQMRMENKEREIAKQIARNAGGARKLGVRLVPLFAKNFFARMLFSVMGENMLSSFISNIGPIRLSPETEALVERFDFIPAPSRVMRVNSSVLSYREELTVCFGSLNRKPEIERRFFRRLAALGVPVKVESNLGA